VNNDERQRLNDLLEVGGKKYKKSTQFKQFLTLSTRAFFSLRQNALIVENLFILPSDLFPGLFESGYVIIII